MEKVRKVAQYISDYKIIVGAITVVLGTAGSFVFGFINLYLNTRMSPIIEQVQAVQSKQVILEQALVDSKAVDTRLESKVDRILLKLIPNANINYSR